MRSHDVARALVSRRAHGLLHEPERGLALIMREIREADAVPHQPGVDVRPFSPCRVVDRKARRLALLRGQLGEQGSSRLYHRPCRNAGSVEREQSRDDPTADATKRLGKRRIGLIEHGSQPGHQIEWPDRWHRRPLPQAEVYGFSCQCQVLQSGFCRKSNPIWVRQQAWRHFRLGIVPLVGLETEEIMTLSNEALRSILPIAGWSDRQAAEVVFAGGADPVLPTPFCIGAAGAAASLRQGSRPPSFGRFCTGRRQQVTVDLRQATASLRSGRYLKLAGASVPSAQNSIMGVYPTQDGRWSYLHCNFPNHRAAALAVLGVAEDRDAVGRAVATWNAADLEEAIIAAGGAGGMARTQMEWAEHPQAVAIAALPLLEIMRIGDSDPEPLPAGDRPLSNIRVLDLTRVLAGPTCARTLAEHGADVMKITAAHLPNLGYQEWDTGHGKLSAELDLRTRGDLDVLRGLVRQADVFSQGYRPGALANRGLAPEELAAIRPGLVYRFPLCLRPYRPLGVAARLRHGRADGERHHGSSGGVRPRQRLGPQFYPVSAIDYCTGYLMAFGAMAALARRSREGGSWLVRTSLAQVGKWIVDLGEVPTAMLKEMPAEFTPDELERWSSTSETPSGRLSHLKPVVQLSQTPTYWARPSVPLGYHRPVWPVSAR